VKVGKDQTKSLLKGIHYAKEERSKPSTGFGFHILGFLAATPVLAEETTEVGTPRNQTLVVEMQSRRTPPANSTLT